MFNRLVLLLLLIVSWSKVIICCCFLIWSHLVAIIIHVLRITACSNHHDLLMMLLVCLIWILVKHVISTSQTSIFWRLRLVYQNLLVVHYLHVLSTNQTQTKLLRFNCIWISLTSIARINLLLVPIDLATVLSVEIIVVYILSQSSCCCVRVNIVSNNWCDNSLLGLVCLNSLLFCLLLQYSLLCIYLILNRCFVTKLLHSATCLLIMMMAHKSSILIVLLLTSIHHMIFNLWMMRLINIFFIFSRTEIIRN